jgi:hypothetical protein
MGAPDEDGELILLILQELCEKKVHGKMVLLLGGNVDFILTCLRWSDEGTKTLVSRGNLYMSWGTLAP